MFSYLWSLVKELFMMAVKYLSTEKGARVLSKILAQIIVAFEWDADDAESEAHEDNAGENNRTGDSSSEAKVMDIEPEDYGTKDYRHH